ncbi:ANTAR domain-containing response regulator [Modestobacter sp. Leaf380]|uniref:ANTAR domain-containing response regulator n=1 Tax=Modestobacter sp. Leaf380 TaxID=1736356 RepID=UPI00350F427A
MHDLETARSEVTNLQAALQTRAGIEQAKGILMAVHGCSAEEAFAILSKESQDTNTKLREVAEQVVARMRGQSTGL